ncbi:MAG: TIR domain-containing protein, partial [Bacteroidota bacterium]
MYNLNSTTRTIALPKVKNIPKERDVSKRIYRKPKIYFSYSNFDRFFVKHIYDQLASENMDIILFHEQEKEKNKTRKELIESANAFVIFVSNKYIESTISNYEFKLIKNCNNSSHYTISALIEKTNL